MRRFLFLLLLTTLQLWSQSDFEKAEGLFRQKKWISAKVYFEQDLKKNPNSLKTIEYLGDIQGHLQNWDECLSYYTKLRTLKPFEANYHYKCGGALGMKAKNSNKLEALGMLSDVRTSFEKAIQLNPNHIEARWALIEYYLQLPGFLGGSERKALIYASQLAKISEVDGMLAKGYIDSYFKRYSKAELWYKKAHEIGQSKMTFEKLFDLYLNKLKDRPKALQLKEEFDRLG